MYTHYVRPIGYVFLFHIIRYALQGLYVSHIYVLQTLQLYFILYILYFIFIFYTVAYKS